MSTLTKNNLYNIKGHAESIPGVRPIVVAEPIVGKWYVGATLSSGEVTYGVAACYQGKGNWRCADVDDFDMYGYDYLQEIP